MNVTYYAVFHYDDELWVSFPDLPGCFSCGNNYETAVEMARDALGLYIDDLSNKQLPTATPLSLINLQKNQQAIKITVEVEVVNGKIVYNNVKRENQK